MFVTRKELNQAASKEKFRVEVLEKSLHLLSLLQSINSNAQIQGKFALKGGTALNLFYFDIPRLSVDIDLNYVGGSTLEDVQRERPNLEEQLTKLYNNKGMTIARSATGHAGGKYGIRYTSLLNQGKGTIEVDLNYMFRTPLFPLMKLSSKDLGGIKTDPILLLSFEEAAAGKLSALLDRNAARDLFDTYHILFHTKYDAVKLKTAFLAYYIMGEEKEGTLSFEKVEENPEDLKNMLRPVMRSTEAWNSDKKCLLWAKEAVLKVRKGLSELLHLNQREQKFLKDYQEKKALDFSLITEDSELAEKIEKHPAIKWVQHKRTQPSRSRGV